MSSAKQGGGHLELEPSLIPPERSDTGPVPAMAFASGGVDLELSGRLFRTEDERANHGKFQDRTFPKAMASRND